MASRRAIEHNKERILRVCWETNGSMRPDLMEPMLNSWFGYGLVATVIVMEIIGIWMIRRIVAIDI